MTSNKYGDFLKRSDAAGMICQVLMQELNMAGCAELHEFSPIEEGAFPQLLILGLSFCKSLVKLPAECTSRGAFPALKVNSPEYL